MRRIRIGNEFTHLWVIERLGEPENLNVATDVVLLLKTHDGTSKAIDFEPVNGNIVRVRFTKSMLNRLADYTLVLEYYMPDDSMPGGVRHNAIDQSVFTIVGKTEQADADVDEFTSTSDVAIGLRGADAFQVWQSQTTNEGKTYEQYIAYLREPMTAAIEEGEQTAAEWAVVEAERVAEELIRKDDEEDRRAAEVIREQVKDATIIAKDDAIQATSDANNAASLANSKADLANDAATLANSKAGLADSAATNANSKADLAVTATTNANNAASLANSKAGIAQTAADNANTKAGLANTAATNANTVATNVANAEAARVASGAELKTNKQNSLAPDGTGNKFPTVDAVNGMVVGELGTSETKVVNQKAVTNEFAAVNIYNVTAKIPLSAGQYYSATTAREAVPVINRKKGCEITYEITNGIWMTEKFIGGAVSGWTTDSLWVQNENPQIDIIPSFQSTFDTITFSESLKTITFGLKGFSLLWRNKRYNLKGDSDLSFSFTNQSDTRRYLYIDISQIIEGDNNWTSNPNIFVNSLNAQTNGILLAVFYTSFIQPAGLLYPLFVKNKSIIVDSVLLSKADASRVISPSYCGNAAALDYVLIDTAANTITFPALFSVINAKGVYQKIELTLQQVVPLVCTDIDGVQVLSSVGYLLIHNTTKQIVHLYHTLFISTLYSNYTLFGIVKRNSGGASTSNVQIEGFFPYKINSNILGIDTTTLNTNVNYLSNQIMSVAFNAYDENSTYLEEVRSTQKIYIKAYDTGYGNSLYVRGIGISTQWTWAAFKAKLLVDYPTAVFATSPLGVLDCLSLAHNNCLAYDFSNAKLIITTPTTRTNSQYIIVQNDSGRVGTLTKDVKFIIKSATNEAKAYIPERATQTGIVAPVASSYMKGRIADNTVANRFNFIHVTDIHYNSLNADKNLAEAIAFQNNSNIAGKIDLIIDSGDNCNGTAGTTKATTVAEIQAFTNRAITSTVPVVNCIGNHDDNINISGGGFSLPNSFINALTKTEQYNYLIKPFVDVYPGIEKVLNKGYYHIDFASKKIRIIILDAVDIPVVDNGDGTLKYRVGFYYSQSQLDWLYITLNSTPSDYAVILVNHGPAVTGFEVGSYTQGLNFISDVINAWKTGSSFSHNYIDSTYSGDLTTSKVFDFVLRGVGEFICQISGHTHALSFLHPDNYADQNIIVGANLWTGASSILYGSKVPYLQRTDNEDLRSSFNIISIDRILKKIFCTTFGAYKDADGVVENRTNVLNY